MYSVEVFPWHKNFEIGVPLIDEQHQRLVELLNVLAELLLYQGCNGTSLDFSRQPLCLAGGYAATDCADAH
jgi:hypothetical protein